MRRRYAVQAALFVLSTVCIAQEQTDETYLSVLEHKWERVRIGGQRLDSGSTIPMREMTPNDKYFQRTARENQPKGVTEPSEHTTDGRAAAIERSVQESRTVKTDDINGFRYIASFRNNSDKKIDVLFWEYRFKEHANPANVIRRQFLCSVKAKPGERFEISAVSSLGPSEVISADSLKESVSALFEEKIVLNRIEFTDGAILQRRDWKMAEVQASVKKAISAPWGKEACKML